MKKIIGMGNALVDVLMQINNDDLLEDLDIPRGSMQLINKDRMLQIKCATKELKRHIMAGGSASNTLSGLSQFGLECGLIGKIGQDEDGAYFNYALSNLHINSHLLKSEHHTGICHVLISKDSERTMNTYLGAALDLKASDLDEDLIKQYDLFHVEGYLVQNKELMTHMGVLSKRHGLKVSLDLASFNIVEECNDFLHDFVREYVDILFANELESRAFTGLSDEKEAVELMAQMVDIAVVKCGNRGSYIKARESKETIFIPALKVNPVVDTTGAGDAYAAGFLSAWSEDLDLESCGKRGTECAAKVIKIIGPRTSFKA